MTHQFIALGGALTAGKDALADYLVEKHHWQKLGMSDILLEHMLILNPWIFISRAGSRNTNYALRTGFRRARDIIETVGYVKAKEIADFRRFMQIDGTEAGRNFFGENIWTDAMALRVQNHLGAGDRVLFTGVRFPNEIAMCQSLGAHTVWVERPGIQTQNSNHASESSLTANDFDEVILNDGSLDDLYVKAELLNVT